MGTKLPRIPESSFQDGVRSQSPIALDPEVLHLLFLHYEALRQWNPRLSLVGPGTADEILSRHYGESLAALPWICEMFGSRPDKSSLDLVDLGTGGGFPGLVLAIAEPRLRVTLVEPRDKKTAFLKTVIRRIGLSCTCLNGRVERPLAAEFPQNFDLITSRALKLSSEHFEDLLERSPDARILLWLGEQAPDLPDNLEIRRSIPLERSRHRRIAEILQSGPPTSDRAKNQPLDDGE